MKRTFTTVMPDQAGAFLAASRCVAGLGLNITRVSYNKAVDMHTLFLEVEGPGDALDDAERELAELGYLSRQEKAGQVILLEFRLRDLAGSVMPVLEIISRYRFNISYISGQENGTDYQHFKMGLFVDDGGSMDRFLQEVSLLCDVRILDYDKSGISLDNTVFYVTFVNDIAEKMHLDEGEKSRLMIYANQIMQMLDERNGAPYKTFSYIGRFAAAMGEYRGERYHARGGEYTTGAGRRFWLVEPPVGSNICILEGETGYLVVDGGFPCYREETLAAITRLIPDFGSRPRDGVLTHGDVDHCGLTDICRTVYAGALCEENFAMERRGEDNVRESNPLHAPYVRISKILAAYQTPPAEQIRALGGRDMPEGDLVPVDVLDWEGMHFEVYAGGGGHVPGEIILVERSHRLAFTGDIFVNIRGFTREQAAFNALAPYLMTSVDTDSERAARERKALMALLGEGEWTVCGGHGALYFAGE